MALNSLARLLVELVGPDEFWLLNRSAADADIVLDDGAISGKHASLRYKDQKFTITDLDSTNGTFLNDRPDPIAREELKDNDILRIGEVTLKFKSL